MANQTIAQFINEIDSDDAIFLTQAVLKRNGILASAQAFANDANHGLAHKYSIFTTLPTAGSPANYYEGVAESMTTSSTVTVNLTTVQSAGRFPVKYFPDALELYNRETPGRYQTIANSMQKGIIYGTDGTLGLATYTTDGWHQYINTNSAQEVQQFQTTSSATACTSIFAVKYAFAPNTDGAYFAIRNTEDGPIYLNENWDIPAMYASATGSVEARYMKYQMDGCMILPGTTNVSAIRGIQPGSTVTVAMIDDLIDAVKGTTDGSTIIYVNGRGRSKIAALKDGKLDMAPDNYGYDIRVYEYNGVPIVVTDHITNTQTGALYGID